MDKRIMQGKPLELESPILRMCFRIPLDIFLHATLKNITAALRLSNNHKTNGDSNMKNKAKRQWGTITKVKKTFSLTKETCGLIEVFSLKRGMKQNEFLIYLLEDFVLNECKVKKPLTDLNKGIAGVGNNINQIAKKMNAYKEIDTAEIDEALMETQILFIKTQKLSLDTKMSMKSLIVSGRVL